MAICAEIAGKSLECKRRNRKTGSTALFDSYTLIRFFLVQIAYKFNNIFKSTEA